MTLHHVYLGLGSNLGDGPQQLEHAIRMIDERVGHVVRRSSFIETEPWGFQSDHRFTNAVVLCVTWKSPREVLLTTQQIERDMGRKKNLNVPTAQRQYADRTIDIDILLYDDVTVDEPDLKIPHPLMQQRDFVMIPLREIKDEK